MSRVISGRRRIGVVLAALSIGVASVGVAGGGGVVEAAGTSATWRAAIVAPLVRGTATLVAATSGTGSLALSLTRARPGTYLAVTLARGTCLAPGASLLNLPAVRVSLAGTATRTYALTTTQVTVVRTASRGLDRAVIRIGSQATGVSCAVLSPTRLALGVVLPNASPVWGDFSVPLRSTGQPAELRYAKDASSELSAVQALIARGIRVLIYCPNDGWAAGPVADAAGAAGVTVISYGRLIQDSAYVAFHTNFDTRAVGAAQGTYLVQRAGGMTGSSLFLYAGAASDPNTRPFLEGAWTVLQPRIADGTFVIRDSAAAVAAQASPSLTRERADAIVAQVSTNWDPGTARALALANLSVLSPAEKGASFILAPNDTTARAIWDAFATDVEVTSAYLTGQDAERASIQSIVDGHQGMTVFKDPRLLASAAVAAARAYLAGTIPAATTTLDNGRIAVPARLLQGRTVTIDTIQAVLIDSGYYRATDFSGSWPGKP